MLYQEVVRSGIEVVCRALTKNGSRSIIAGKASLAHAGPTLVSVASGTRSALRSLGRGCGGKDLARAELQFLPIVDDKSRNLFYKSQTCQLLFLQQRNRHSTGR